MSDAKNKMKSAPDNEINNQDFADFESRIEAAMAKIVQDTLAEREEYYSQNDDEDEQEADDVYFDEADEDYEYDGNLILTAGEDDFDEDDSAYEDSESEDESEEDASDEDSEEDASDEDSGEEADDQEKADEDEDADDQEDAEDDDSEAAVAAAAVVHKKSARPGQNVYVPVNDIMESQKPESEEKQPKKHKGLKVTGLLAGMLVVAAGTAYAGISYYYSNRFFEGTTINGYDCSRMTAYEVEQILTEKLDGYSIDVLARNQAGQTIAGSAINYKYVSDGEVLECLQSQKPYEWIKGYIEPDSYQVKENATYDKELLKDQLRELECAKFENQVPPENAYIAYNDNLFEIVPETEGSELNIKQAYQILEQAVSDSSAEVDFSANEDAYYHADVLSDDEGLIQSMDACNNFARASITYDMGYTDVVLDGSVIKDWLAFDENNQLVQDETLFNEHIRQYVAELAAEYDTVGTTREFLTTSGRTVYVYGSAYGWLIDQESEVAQLAQDIADGVVTTREPVYSMRANARGANDFGDTYIEVDMGYQHMYYYQNGSIIFDSDFVSGNPNLGRATPPGIFTLYYKSSPAVLRGDMDENGNYGYETPVTFWMPFNGGVGFHDATWQPYYGGDLYLWNGSHGCINLPYSSAATLYSIIEYGIPIIVFN